MFHKTAMKKQFSFGISSNKTKSKSFTENVFTLMLIVALTSNLVQGIDPYVKDPNFSIVDNTGNMYWKNNNNYLEDKEDDFNYGEEFMVDEILKELHEMGLRPKVNNTLSFKGNFNKKNEADAKQEFVITRETKPKSVGNSDAKITAFKEDSLITDDDFNFEESDYVVSEDAIQTVRGSENILKNDVINKENSIKSEDYFEHISAVPHQRVRRETDEDGDETVLFEGESTKNIVKTTKISDKATAKDQTATKNSDKSTQISDKTTARDQTVTQHSDKSTQISDITSKTSDNFIEEEEDISDIVGLVKGERQARLFYNYDRGSAFNTSVAFTIPLFSFTLPGAGDITDDGLDGNVFGTMAFVSLFLLGGLGVAIYTTTQGAVGDDGAGPRSLHSSTAYEQAILPAKVLTAIEGLGEALDVESCAQLAVCQSYARPDTYGLIGLPLRLYAPISSVTSYDSQSASSDDSQSATRISPLQEAARFASGAISAAQELILAQSMTEAGKKNHLNSYQDDISNNNIGNFEADIMRDEAEAVVTEACFRRYQCLLDPMEALVLAVDVVAGKYA